MLPESQSLAFVYRVGIKRGTPACQPFEVVRDEAWEVAQVVSPFEKGEDPAAADLGGQLGAPVTPGAEALAGDAHAAQRIGLPGVEAGREEEDVGSEAPQGGEDPALDRFGVAVVAGAGGQWHVDGEALAGPSPGFARGAGAGVKGELVGAGVEDVGSCLEDVLRAVAVVDVEVEDRHPRGAAAAQVLGGDRGVVEEAEAHGGRAPGVVAPRAGPRPS